VFEEVADASPDGEESRLLLRGSMSNRVAKHERSRSPGASGDANLTMGLEIDKVEPDEREKEERCLRQKVDETPHAAPE